VPATPLEVGEVIRRFGPAFLDRYGPRLTPNHRKVLAALAACRTPAMGWRIYRCDHCGHTVPLYNSCGDRHCPTCQAGRRAEWLDKQRETLLPVDYYQVVFTVPHQLNGIAAAHPRTFYDLLFRAVRETLLEVAASPKHLGAEIGGLMVLHTWGGALQRHPHVHVIVPGGGLKTGPGSDADDRPSSASSASSARWVWCPREFFLPVKVLSRVFRGKLLAFLRKQYEAGNLPMTGRLSALADARRFARWRSKLYQMDWGVNVQPPKDRPPEQALKYLARYTYRVAISNPRIEAIEGDGHHGWVTFWYKDHTRDGAWCRTRLPGVEFLRRFCTHVLPRGFVRIRSFGFLANCHRAEKLALIRRLLAADQPESDLMPAEEPMEEPMEAPGHRCPHCGEPALRLVAETARPRLKDLVAATYRLPPWDST
jgi:DNA-directed RNA polymerase subunit RPC12/RpoP